MIKVAGILLAGGESKRYGSNKLLSLHATGVPLLMHSLTQFDGLGLATVGIVTGRWHDELIGKLKGDDAHHDVHVYYNEAWSEGIASSIRCGVSQVALDNSDITHVLVHLADLACVTTDTLQTLLNQVAVTPNNIIYSQWCNEEGNVKATVPAIFPKAAFSQLRALSGDTGAKKVIQKWQSEGRATGVEHPESQFDIDVPSDWNSFVG